MKYFCGVIFFLSILGCDNPYRANILELGLGFSAQSACSCRWVVELTEFDCTEYAKIKRAANSVHFDDANKIATSRSFIFFRERAKFINSELGCRLL